jgi:hypothetical protein
LYLKASVSYIPEPLDVFINRFILPLPQDH